MKKMRGITALVVAIMLILSVVPFGISAESATIKTVTYTMKDGMVYFEVVTGEGYNRVKVATADNPTGYVKYTNDCVDMGDGTYVWTLKIAQPDAETTYVFDARNATTKNYMRDYYSLTYAPQAVDYPINSVEHTVESGTVYFSVVTDAGYNRVKIALASDPSTALAVGSKGVANADGTITWTVKLPEPTTETKYIFDARSSETGKYTKEYFDYTYTPTAEPEKPVKSVESFVEAGKLCFNVVTGEGYNRIKIALASSPSSSIAISDKATVNGDGTISWVIKIDNPDKAETYVFDARLTETGKYTKEYFEYAYTPVEEVEAFQSVSTEIVGDKAIFTIITDDIFNRVKISYADNPTSYIKYTNNYTDLGNGTYRWVITIDAPEAETKYILDGRFSSTNKYAKENYEYTLRIEEKEMIKSVDVQEVDGSAVFTVVTTKGYNRVKVAYADNASKHIKYTSTFTELENGDRQWVIAIDMPEETTEYSIDARLISTSNYAREYYNCTVVVEEPIVSPFVSINVTNSAYYANVIVVTTEGCESVVASYTVNGEAKSVSVSSYTVNADGNRVFVCSVAVPKVNTVFSADMFDAKGRKLDTAQITYYAGVDHEIIS